MPTVMAKAVALGLQHGVELATLAYDSGVGIAVYRRCLELENDPGWYAEFGVGAALEGEPDRDYGPEDVLLQLDTTERAVLPVYQQAFYAS